MTVVFSMFLLLPGIVLAAAPSTINLPNPLGTTNILDLSARLIKAGLGITGSLALLFFIYGGFLWLTSGGSPDKIKKGRDVFLWSVVGLVIIFSSYLMVDFVIKAMTQASQKAADKTLYGCYDKADIAADSCNTNCDNQVTAPEEVKVKCKKWCDEDYAKAYQSCKPK
jgi:hypothetical protein